MRFFGTKEIKEHVRRVLDASADRLRDASALDFPAGNGVTSAQLAALGARVQALDLFPELFRVPGISCRHGDLSGTYPLEALSLDYAVCQEGIEHVGNQEHVFQEFARVIKPGGRLLMTTPNYSSIKSKLSYLFCESEAFGRIMPPNEHDSIWLSPPAPGQQPRVYFGHCFLTGFFRLRLFAKLAGFKLTKIHDSRVNTTSLLFFPLIYPFVLLHSWRTARRFKRKAGQMALADELFAWMISPRLLLENHLVLEFERLPLSVVGSAGAGTPADRSLESFTT